MKTVIRFSDTITVAMLAEIEKLFDDPTKAPLGFPSIGKPEFSAVDQSLGFQHLEIELFLGTQADIERALELFRIVAKVP